VGDEAVRYCIQTELIPIHPPSRAIYQSSSGLFILYVQIMGNVSHRAVEERCVPVKVRKNKEVVTMKRIAVLLGLVVVFAAAGCGEKDDEFSFSPPAWIYGTWSDSTNANRFVFSENSVQQVFGGVITDFNEVYGKTKDVHDETTDTTYVIYIPEVNAAFRFGAYGSTKIKYSLTNGGITSSTIYLSKR
jgi:hypothetical protein